MLNADPLAAAARLAKEEADHKAEKERKQTIRSWPETKVRPCPKSGNLIFDYGTHQITVSPDGTAHIMVPPDEQSKNK